MPNYTQAKLDNGEIVNVVIPPGMTEDQAGVAFMRNYNANKAAFETPQQPQAQPQQASAQPAPSTGPPGVMSPQQPGTWDTIKDMASSLLSSAPKTAANLSYALTTMPAWPKAVYDKLTLGKPSQELKDWDRIAREGAGEWGAAGAGYQPQTAAGDLTGQIGSGMVGAALTRLGIPSTGDLALGAASGGLGYAGQKSGGDNGLGDLMGTAAATAPYLARAGTSMLNPASRVYSTARGDIARTMPEQAARAQALEPVAQAAGAPTMAWQHFDPDTAMYKRGAAVAQTPGAEQVQANFSALQGGGPAPEHAAADTLSATQHTLPSGQTMNVTPNPDALRLAAALRRTDALRNADVSASPMTSAATHETGDVALALHALKPVLPPGASELTGGLEFAKLGGLKHLMQAPTRKAMDELYSSPTWDQFKQLAQTNPKADALRQVMQAYLVPQSLGLGPTPLGAASMGNTQ